MKSRVLLFHPRTLHQDHYPTFWLPYSILSIGSAGNNEGHEMVLVDNNIRQVDDFYSFLNREIDDSTVIGISTMIGRQLHETTRIAAAAKAINPNVPIIVGGPAPTMIPELMLELPSIDFAVRGQGELTFQELMRSLGTRRFSSIEGLSYKEGRRIIHNPGRTPIKRELLPSFNFDLLDAAPYVNNDEVIGARTLNYVASQGCAFGCGFCSDTTLFEGRWVPDSNQRVYRDLSSLVTQHDLTGIKFYDSNFLQHPDFVKGLLRKIVEGGLHLSWGATVHPKTLSELSDDYMALLTKSGCSRLMVGLESPNQEVLDLVGKGVKKAELERVVRRLSENGIIGSFSLIVGFPGVDEDHYRETIDFGYWIKEEYPLHDVKIHFYAPFPMTKLFPLAIQGGYIPPNSLQEWGDYNYYDIQTPFADARFKEEIKVFNNDNCRAVNKKQR